MTEGKFSFPIIHSIRSNTSNKELVNILKQKTNDVTLKEYAVSYMRQETDSFGYCERKLKEFEAVAKEMIVQLEVEGKKALEIILEAMLKIE